MHLITRCSPTGTDAGFTEQYTQELTNFVAEAKEMAELKPFEVIMRLYPIAGQNGKGEVCMKAERVSELIRCRECKHHDGIRCFRWNSTIITGFDDFCSNGERRDEDEET